MNDLPKLALSIMQPWAWLIVSGNKDIENRKWQTDVRGLVAIHAGKKVDGDCAYSLAVDEHPVTGLDYCFQDIPNRYQVGGIVGVAEIVDCVDRSVSPWFMGPYGFVIRNAQPVDFIPVRGALGFFDWRRNLV